MGSENVCHDTTIGKPTELEFSCPVPEGPSRQCPFFVFPGIFLRNRGRREGRFIASVKLKQHVIKLARLDELKHHPSCFRFKSSILFIPSFFLHFLPLDRPDGYRCTEALLSNQHSGLWLWKTAPWVRWWTSRTHGEIYFLLSKTSIFTKSKKKF